MSPRSAEFMAAAHGRLAAARSVETTDAAAAVSLAYYAMLYAARAALSERDVYARTHRSTWHEFQAAFVQRDQFPAELAAAAQREQPARERADYEAWPASAEEAHAAIATAERFLAAVERMLGSS